MDGLRIQLGCSGCEMPHSAWWTAVRPPPPATHTHTPEWLRGTETQFDVWLIFVSARHNLVSEWRAVRCRVRQAAALPPAARADRWQLLPFRPQLCGY